MFMLNRIASAKYLPPMVGKMPNFCAGATTGPDGDDCMVTRTPRGEEGSTQARPSPYTRQLSKWRDLVARSRPRIRHRRRPRPPESLRAGPLDRLDLDEDQELGAGGDGAGDAEVHEAGLRLEDARLDPGRDQQGLADRPALDRLVEPGLDDLGDVDVHLARADLARGDHAGPVEVLDRVGRQLDGGVEGVAVVRQQRAQAEVDPLLEL